MTPLMIILNTTIKPQQPPVQPQQLIPREKVSCLLIRLYIKYVNSTCNLSMLNNIIRNRFLKSFSRRQAF